MCSQESHGGIHLAQDHAQDGFGAGLSAGRKTPQRQAAEEHSFRAQRKIFENVGATPDAAIEHDRDIAASLGDAGQDLQGRYRAIELLDRARLERHAATPP